MIDLTECSSVGRGAQGLSTEARGHAAMSAEISYVGHWTRIVEMYGQNGDQRTSRSFDNFTIVYRVVVEIIYIFPLASPVYRIY